jgi:hypothetical protein
MYTNTMYPAQMPTETTDATLDYGVPRVATVCYLSWQAPTTLQLFPDVAMPHVALDGIQYIETVHGLIISQSISGSRLSGVHAWSH